MGFYIAKFPWIVIFGSFVVAGVLGAGVSKFYEETDAQKLFVPQNSVAVSDQKWVDMKFPGNNRYERLIVTAKNVLTPESLKAVKTLCSYFV